MKKIAALFILALSLVSCFKSNKVSKIVVADWLLGKWEHKTANGLLLEIWKKKNDSVFSGQSYYIQEKDTLHFEEIQLIQKGENLLYVSTIKGQNNDEPVTFVQNTEIEKQLVFENKKNNYPNKITYFNNANGNIVIQISGIQQGKPSSSSYLIKKTE